MKAEEIRSLVLSFKALDKQPLRAPEWPGVKAFIPEMRGDVYDQYRALCREALDTGMADELFQAKLACLVVVDEDGGKVFKPEDAEALAAGPVAPLRRINRMVGRMNALFEYEDREIEKN